MLTADCWQVFKTKKQAKNLLPVYGFPVNF
jgi:hypothetical protein